MGAPGRASSLPAAAAFSIASAFLNSASILRGPPGNRCRKLSAAASASLHRASARSASRRTSSASASGTVPLATRPAHSIAPAASPRRNRQRAALYAW